MDTTLQSLPSDLLLDLILPQLSAFDFVNLSSTNKFLHTLVHSSTKHRGFHTLPTMESPQKCSQIALQLAHINTSWPNLKLKLTVEENKNFVFPTEMWGSLGNTVSSLELRNVKCVEDFGFVTDCVDELRVMWCNVKSASTLNKKLLTSSTLKTLILQNNHLGEDDVLGLFKSLQTNTSVTHFAFNFCSLSTEEIKTARDMLSKNKHIESITLYAVDLGVAGAEILSSGFAENTNLKHVDLGANCLDVVGAQHITSALKRNRTVRSLALNGNNLGAEGVAFVADLLVASSSIQTVDLRCNKLGPLGAQSISAALTTNKTATSINLAGNNIGDEGSKSICECLSHNTTLIDLDLSANCITADTVTRLDQMLSPNSSLSSIGFAGNQGAQLLCGLMLKHTTVKTIRLGGGKTHDFANREAPSPVVSEFRSARFVSN